MERYLKRSKKVNFMYRIKTVLLGFILLLVALKVNAQITNSGKWEQDIRQFEESDKANPPEEGVILFVGSSSIAMWKDLDDYFPDHKVLNRGFGGSQFEDLLYYADRVIFPYKPSKIFIYEGDNDIAAGDKPGKVFREAKELREMIARELPDVPVVFIAAKPSIARWNQRKDYKKMNRRLKKYADNTRLTMFADVWEPMLDEDGKVYPDVFLEDDLHMNAKGYKIWQSVLAPFMDEEKKE